MTENTTPSPADRARMLREQLQLIWHLAGLLIVFLIAAILLLFATAAWNDYRTDVWRRRAAMTLEQQHIAELAIQEYRHSPKASRRPVPRRELKANVIDPLVSAGVLPKKLGEDVLSAVIDAGKDIATDTYHQLLAKWLEGDDKGAPKSSVSMTCAPVIQQNVAPAPREPVKTETPPPKPKKPPKLCPPVSGS